MRTSAPFHTHLETKPTPDKNQSTSNTTVQMVLASVLICHSNPASESQCLEFKHQEELHFSEMCAFLYLAGLGNCNYLGEQ